MDLDREHGRGLVHHPGHPLGWPGLPPPDGLPGPPPPPPAHLSSLSSPSQTPQTLAGDPNGVPPPGNSGIPATTGPSTPANGGAMDGLALQGSRPVPLQVFASRIRLKKHQFTSKYFLGGQAYPPAWYGGPGGGEPVARTNHERHATGSPATTTSSPSEATNGSSSRSSVPPPDWEARAGACSWEWWPPDPPPEWALDGAPWEPPGLPPPPPAAGGHHPPYHPEGERTGAW